MTFDTTVIGYAFLIIDILVHTSPPPLLSARHESDHPPPSRHTCIRSLCCSFDRGKSWSYCAHGLSLWRWSTCYLAPKLLPRIWRGIDLRGSLLGCRQNHDQPLTALLPSSPMMITVIIGRPDHLFSHSLYYEISNKI